MNPSNIQPKPDQKNSKIYINLDDPEIVIGKPNINGYDSAEESLNYCLMDKSPVVINSNINSKSKLNKKRVKKIKEKKSKVVVSSLEQDLAALRLKLAEMEKNSKKLEEENLALREKENESVQMRARLLNALGGGSCFSESTLTYECLTCKSEICDQFFIQFPNCTAQVIMCGKCIFDYKVSKLFRTNEFSCLCGDIHNFESYFEGYRSKTYKTISKTFSGLESETVKIFEDKFTSLIMLYGDLIFFSIAALLEADYREVHHARFSSFDLFLDFTSIGILKFEVGFKLTDFYVERRVGIHTLTGKTRKYKFENILIDLLEDATGEEMYGLLQRTLQAKNAQKAEFQGLEMYTDAIVTLEGIYKSIETLCMEERKPSDIILQFTFMLLTLMENLKGKKIEISLGDLEGLTGIHIIN